MVGAAEGALARVDDWIRKRFRLRAEVEKQLLKISARQIGRPFWSRF